MMAASARAMQLGEVIRFGNGKAIKPGGEGCYPVYGSNGIIGGCDEFRYENGIIIGRVGAYCGSVAYCPDKFWASDNTLVAFPASDQIDTKFLFFLLTDVKLSRYAGGAAQPLVTQTVLKQVEVVVPPLSVQRRIAGILSAYDELIANNQRRIRILETMARTLYREWFVHFRFPGYEKLPRVASPLGEIPKGWEVGPFTEIADVLSGGTPKTDVSEYWNGEIPFFTPRDVPDCFYVQDTDKHVTELGVSKCASEHYQRDTVFITARGTVGKVALPSVPMAMNQSCYALRGKAGISQRFLFLMTLQLVDYLKTNTGGATFDTIVVDTFRRMQVVKPPHEVIARFTSYADALFEQMNTLQRHVQNLRCTRDLLLPRLLSGQVDVLKNTKEDHA